MGSKALDKLSYIDSIHDNSENVNGKFSNDNNIDYDTHDFTGGKYSLVGEDNRGNLLQQKPLPKMARVFNV